jgi:P4 family phage/plasmid primase-like protien
MEKATMINDNNTQPTKSDSKDALTSWDALSETMQLYNELSNGSFDDNEWIGRISKNPNEIPLSIKEICFHNLDARGKPTGVNDDRIFNYLIHTQHIFVCGGVPYIYRNGYYHMDLRGTIIKTLIRECIIENYVKSSTIDRVFKLFLQDYRIEKTPDELNHHSGFYINFENGMYDVKKKKIYPHTPTILSINQVPMRYDPNGDHGSGNEIEKFLKFAIPNDDDREMLLEYIGLCCSIDTSQQKMLVICGEGGTGKSTVINLIQKLIGKRNISNVSMNKLQDNFQAIRMMGKLLNSCADLEIDALDDVTMIKKLIGEDSISDSYKGKDVISFDNYAKLLFSTNELPLVRNEKTDGFYRRLLILSMDEVPEYRDPDLPKRLEKELPYLLHMAMEALNRMYARGRIIVSKKSEEKAKQLRNDSDTVEAFLDECCTITHQDSDRVDRKDLYGDYCSWCEEWERQSHQKNGFFKALRNKRFKEIKSHGNWYFCGLKYGKEEPVDENGYIQFSVDNENPFDFN